MGYEIRSLQGVGAIDFGMSPLEVRGLIKAKFKSFKRSSKATYPCDYFPSVGVFAYYKASGELEALEFALPAQPVFEGKDLLGMGFDAAKILLLSKDPALEIEVDGAISRSLGISLYAPLAKDDPAGNCESILVFEQGYYD